MSTSILITGCSSGIGLCAAQTLQQRGYQVYATARNTADLEMLKNQGIESLFMDMEDPASIQQSVATVLEKTGGTLDALFSNAGYAVPGAVEDLTRAMLRKQFETNVFGPIELTNLILPIMRKQGHGRIILNTSILGVITMPYRGAYNASKFALEAFGGTLRQELRGTPIFVSIIAPGPIKTRFRDNAGKSYRETLENKPSVHQSAYQSMQKYFNKETSKTETALTAPPDAVVTKLIHALESARPKARYYIGLPAHAFALLRRLLPDKALDWVVAQTLRGEK